MWLIRNVWYFFLVPGLLLMVAGLVYGWQTARFRGTAERAEGTVIENVYTTDSDGGGFYHPKVEFTARDGQTYTFVSRSGSMPASFRVGDRVKVLYAANQPGDASLDTFSYQWLGPLILTSVGLIFALIGGIPLALRARAARLAEWLKLNGQPIQAIYTGTRMHTTYEVNGRYPYRITAQWTDPATNGIRVFESSNFWIDPAPHISAKTIRVLLDPQNPKRYWMDTTFLPKLEQ